MRRGLLLLLAALLVAAAASQESAHTNNWAVLVCTSRFWFNYRHVANTLSVYHTVKRLGIPDQQIILMLADDMACNARNPFPATIFNDKERQSNLYSENVEVDYRGYEVTVENFIRVLTDRHSPDVPKSKRLATDDSSNVLIYLTGHGGDEFLKFQDADEVNSFDLAYAFQQMFEKQRYNELLFIVDTCQATTLYSQFYSPNVLAIGSSGPGENSYSHHGDQDMGVAVIDRFTYYMLEFLQDIDMRSNATLQNMLDSFDPETVASHPGHRSFKMRRKPSDIRVTDFFGSVLDPRVTTASLPLDPVEPEPVPERAQAPATNMDGHAAAAPPPSPAAGDARRPREVPGEFWVAAAAFAGALGLLSLWM